MAIILTLVTNKDIHKTKQYKNTANTSTHITKRPTHYKTRTHTHTHTHTHIVRQTGFKISVIKLHVGNGGIFY